MFDVLSTRLYKSTHETACTLAAAARSLSLCYSEALFAQLQHYHSIVTWLYK